MHSVDSVVTGSEGSHSSGGALSKALITAAALAFFFVFPRVIVPWLGEDNPWTSYLYLYGNGLIVFLVGLRVILKSGACRLGRGRDTFWFVVLLLGYVFFAAMHAAWILAALRVPVKGAL